MNRDKPDRPFWRAALWGMLIAAGETVAGFVMLLVFDAFGPAPSGYAGAGFGSALALVFHFLLIGAAMMGAIVGAIFFRRRRSLLVMVGAPLLPLGALCLLVMYVLRSA
jgi:hypothetical protein